MDLTTMSPAEIDALWFPLMDKEAVAEGRAEAYEGYAAKSDMAYQRERYEAAAAEYRQEAAQAAEAQAPFVAEWVRRGGWVRAYLAQSTNGHIHSAMNCPTCNNGKQSTRFARLPQVSGLTHAEIVELAGERACTVCYPDAPVEKLGQPTRLFSEDEIKARAEREAKRVAKADKDAKKAAAAIANPDGSPLIGYGGSWDVIKTERTAWITAVDISFNHRAYNYQPHAEVLFRIITALAAKTGRTFEEVHAEVEAKVQAKARREHVTI